MKQTVQALFRGPAKSLYPALAPVFRAAARHGATRLPLETLMRLGGRSMLWSFNAAKQRTPEAVTAEWRRILSELGIASTQAPAGCATCFNRCTLELRPGDGAACSLAMSINDEMVKGLGGRLEIKERLTDPGGTQCRVEVEAPDPEAVPWFTRDRASRDFDAVAPFYDWIMGYFEIPANRRAMKLLFPSAAARVLDLGAGTGMSTLALARQLPESSTLIAIDRSAPMLDQASRRLGRAGLAGRVTFLQGDATQPCLEPGSIDLVYSSFLLDLMGREERTAALVQIRQVLRPGGRACLVVMNAQPDGAARRALADWYTRWYGRWNPVWHRLFQGYAPHCRPISMEDQVRAAGFSVVEQTHALVAAFPVAIYLVARTSEVGAT